MRCVDQYRFEGVLYTAPGAWILFMSSMNSTETYADQFKYYNIRVLIKVISCLVIGITSMNAEIIL